MACHNNIRDRVADLSGKDITPTHVRDDPIIFAGCAVKRPIENPVRPKATKSTPATPPLETTENKGDLLIHDLWQNGTDSVQNMHFLNTDANPHLEKTPEKCLQEAEREKKKMYLEEYLQQRRQFYPFVASVDGLLGVETTYTLKRIASRLTKSGGNPTLGRVYTSIVGLPSLWCGTHMVHQGVQGYGAQD